MSNFLLKREAEIVDAYRTARDVRDHLTAKKFATTGADAILEDLRQAWRNVRGRSADLDAYMKALDARPQIDAVDDNLELGRQVHEKAFNAFADWKPMHPSLFNRKITALQVAEDWRLPYAEGSVIAIIEDLATTDDPRRDLLLAARTLEQAAERYKEK